MKNLALSLALIVVSIWVYIKSFPKTIEQNIAMELIQNNTSIKNVRQDIAQKSRKSYTIDTINFQNGNTLIHKSLGPMYAQKDFFLTFKTAMKTKKSGKYSFLISSDDGFLLKIDGKELCAFEKDRPISSTECTIELEEGLHILDLKYFQGYGNLGLQAKYYLEDQEASYIGEESDYIEFALVDSP